MSSRRTSSIDKEATLNLIEAAETPADPETSSRTQKEKKEMSRQSKGSETSTPLSQGNETNFSP